MADLHARRDVNEASSTEDSAVECRELVVTAWDDLPEPFPEDFRVFLEPLGTPDKDDPLFADGGLDIGVGGLAVELSLDARKELPLLLRDTETLKGPLHILRDIIPTPLRNLALGEVVADVFEDDVLQVLRSPVSRHRLLKKLPVALLSECPHPIGISLDVTDVVNGRLGEADPGVKGVIDVVAEIADGTVDVDIWLGLGTHGKGWLG